MKKNITLLFSFIATLSFSNSIETNVSYCQLTVSSKTGNGSITTEGTLFCSDQTGTDRFQGDEYLDASSASIDDFKNIDGYKAMAKSRRFKYLNKIIETNNEEDHVISYRVTNCQDSNNELVCFLEKTYTTKK